MFQKYKIYCIVYAGEENIFPLYDVVHRGTDDHDFCFNILVSKERKRR
jgi:hypothetical protein